jgi:regulator of sigma E protease
VPLIRYAVLDDDLAAAPLQAMVDQTRQHVVGAVRAQAGLGGIAGTDGVIAEVDAMSPAGQKGLQQGQRIVAVDGRALRTASDLPLALSADKDAAHVIGLIDGRGDGSVFVFLLAPSTRRELGGQKVLGVTLTQAHGDAATMVRGVGPLEAARRAVRETGETIAAVAAGYVMLVSGEVGLDQLGGPVMLANIAGEAARSGVEVFAATTALLSVNLALLNLLPVPVLDGGHLMLFTIEAVRRRRLTPEARLRATKVGLVFVGLLMAVALFNDVRSLFG